MGRDRLYQIAYLNPHFGFNPRARMGRDNSEAFARNISKVSIHAPAWGATFVRLSFTRSFFVSIHAPAWGATTYGSDPEFELLVSIHAPAWGATRKEDESKN